MLRLSNAATIANDFQKPFSLRFKNKPKTVVASMKLHTETRTYKDDNGVQLERYAAWDESSSGRRPGVLVAHTAIGPQEDFVRDKVHRMAELGYVGMALDMFGAGKCVFGKEKDEYNGYLKQDRSRVRHRALAALNDLQNIPLVDKTKLGAIGYCLGGKVCLDLARADPEGLCGVVSFHGILDSPDTNAHSHFNAKVLACHGNLDPFITPDMMQAFVSEMENRRVDYQLMVFGGCYHAFTRPDKTSEVDKANGFQYSPAANSRSWALMKDFLEEIFT